MEKPEITNAELEAHLQYEPVESIETISVSETRH